MVVFLGLNGKSGRVAEKSYCSAGFGFVNAWMQR